MLLCPQEKEFCHLLNVCIPRPPEPFPEGSLCSCFFNYASVLPLAPFASERLAAAQLPSAACTEVWANLLHEGPEEGPQLPSNEVLFKMAIAALALLLCPPGLLSSPKVRSVGAPHSSLKSGQPPLGQLSSPTPHLLTKAPMWPAPLN